MDVFASPTAGGSVAVGQEVAGTSGSANGVSLLACPCSAW